jgi:hypothetical protein
MSVEEEAYASLGHQVVSAIRALWEVAEGTRAYVHREVTLPWGDPVHILLLNDEAMLEVFKEATRTALLQSKASPSGAS